MILVDERGGSGGLEAAKRRLNHLRSRGADAELGHLEYGDYAIAGNGPDNTTVMVGVELKTTKDIINSLRSGRLIGHQIPGMVGTDGDPGMYDRSWLLTEGIWREGGSGDFECYQGSWQTCSVGSRSLSYSDLESWVLSTILLGGLSYWHCSTTADTARFITNLDHWWTSKEYDAHKSANVIFQRPPDRVSFHEPSEFLQSVAAFKKVGWTRGRAIEATCGERPFERLMAMSVQELQEIEGIGKVIATYIWETLHGVQKCVRAE